jgi:protoporphyrinogen oxidase
MNDLVILGGGSSGLSLGILTGAPILEGSSLPGGHALSTIIDGYTYDRGPHIMFSRSKLLLDCMVSSLGSNVHQCLRNNKVSVSGRLLKYPIENDLGTLSTRDRIACVTDYVKAQITRAAGEFTPANLADYFSGAFGSALTDLYFRPYNEKIWKTRLEDLSMVWSERIPAPPVEDVLKSALGESTEGYLHQLHYHYPRTGGYSALMESWSKGISKDKLHLSTVVQKIIPHSGGVRVVTSNGTHEAGVVASTLPLHALPNLVDGMPSQVEACIRRLRTNATVIITMGFKGVDENKWTAVYVPDKDFMPNRISYPAVFSPENAPPGCFSIQSEIIIPTLSDVSHLDDDFFTSHVLEGLRSRGLIPNGAELSSVYVDRYELAYVVYTQGFESDLRIVMSWAREKGIILHGRFGSHNYLNVDGCLEQSIGLARQLGFELDDAEIMTRFERLGASR